MTKGHSKWISADYLDPQLHRGAPTRCAEPWESAGFEKKDGLRQETDVLSMNFKVLYFYSGCLFSPTILGNFDKP